MSGKNDAEKKPASAASGLGEDVKVEAAPTYKKGDRVTHKDLPEQAEVLAARDLKGGGQALRLKGMGPEVHGSACRPAK